VSCVTFKNKRDPEKIEKALKEYLKQFDESEHKKAKLDFELSLADRYFMTDDNDEANSFEMYIESKEVLLPEIILYNSLDILKNKLNSFYVNLTKIIKDNEEVDTVKINESLDTMESFEIEILNESHTLGNIIQNYALLTKGNNMLKFIAYKNPHPLENKILIKIATVDNTLEQVYIVIENTVKNIISIVDSLLKQIGKED
jgi:DNA-directed RNA polymerase, subunit L